MSNEPKPRPAILILEDEPQLTLIICDLIGDDFEIETAEDADEALQLLGQRKFDILLSDQMLPGKKQGLDFLMEAMEKQPQAKRILMTGYLNPELLSRGTTMAGLSACLLKPVDSVRLKEALRMALNRPDWV
jgi:two-component system response regulator HupR/HoxA